MRAALFRLRARAAVRPGAFAAYGARTLVHPPLAVTDRSRVAIGADCFVLADATLSVGPAGRLQIGSRCYLGRDLVVLCEGSVVVGDDVMASDRVLLCDVAPEPVDPAVAVGAQALGRPRPVRIGDGVFLGTGAMVLPGVTVGERSVIGAGAVVFEDVPPNAVAVGNPARVVRHFDHARGAWVDGPPPS